LNPTHASGTAKSFPRAGGFFLLRAAGALPKTLPKPAPSVPVLHRFWLVCAYVTGWKDSGQCRMLQLWNRGSRVQIPSLTPTLPSENKVFPNPALLGTTIIVCTLFAQPKFSTSLPAGFPEHQHPAKMSNRARAFEESISNPRTRGAADIFPRRAAGMALSVPCKNCQYHSLTARIAWSSTLIT
jgi:hypothetical protein